MGKKPKVIIIGLDGGTFKILDKQMKIGNMPVLKSTCDNGIKAILKSTIPPLTAPAWVTFSSGESPGRHPIFSFYNLPKESLEEAHSIITKFPEIKTKFLWDYLNSNNYKVGVCDLPITRQVKNIDGVLVSGLATSGLEFSKIIPNNLRDEIKKIAKSDFDDSLAKGAERSERYIKKLIREMNRKSEIDQHIMKNYELDCFITVYTMVDTLQHYFWKDIEINFLNENKKKNKYYKLIMEFYKQLDKAIENLLKNIGKDDYVFFVSDHGFCPAKKRVFVNKLLKDNGIISLMKKKSKNIGPEKLISYIVKLDFLNLRRFLNKKRKKAIKNKLQKIIEGEIDWKNTKAYLRVSMEQGVYINKQKYINGNVSDEQYKSTRNKVISLLKNLKDPETNKRAFKGVHKKEDIVKGEYLQDAPDILLEPEEGYIISSSLEAKDTIEKQPDLYINGTHDSDGIFIAKGKNIDSNKKLGSAGIEDVAPTILNIYGIEKPSRMNGKVLRDILINPTKTSKKKPANQKLLNDIKL